MGARKIAIDTDWVLLLDADEFVSPPLWDEIRKAIEEKTRNAGFMIRKAFHFLGRPF